jgi:hypothetical protein
MKNQFNKTATDRQSESKANQKCIFMLQIARNTKHAVMPFSAIEAHPMDTQHQQ